MTFYKKRIYAEAEIREYWVVNLSTAELIVFPEPLKNDYAIKTPWNSATMSPLAFPDVNIVLKIY